MKLIITVDNFNNNFLLLKCPVIKEFHKFIQNSIKPNSLRIFDKDNKYWKIHWKCLQFTVKIARRYFNAIDLSTLSKELQIFAFGGPIPRAISNKQDNCPYSKLFLVSETPFLIVKKVKAELVRLYHPDHNNGVGNPERLQEVLNSFKEIENKVNHHG